MAGYCDDAGGVSTGKNGRRRAGLLHIRAVLLVGDLRDSLAFAAVAVRVTVARSAQLIAGTRIFMFWTQFAFRLYRVHMKSVHIQAGMLPSRKLELAVHTWFSSNHLS